MECNNCSNKSDHISPIIKVVDYCNFLCDFCRYPNNEKMSTMAFSTYTDIVKKAIEYNISHGYNQLSIIYHGGEPLLWGYNNFIEAMKFQEDVCSKSTDFKFRNSIQTNGYLLDKRWIKFL